MTKPKIAVAADHGGYELKEAVKAALNEKNYETVDLGTFNEASVDYPVYGHKLARYIAGGGAEKGVAVCGTGMGIAIAANKVRGIRCCVVVSDDYARLAAGHNNANIIALGGRFTNPEDAIRYVDIWLNTKFEGGRHERRVEELNEM